MLQLKNIIKTYETGDFTQDALRGVSITFRENEFVSILGQSGSGKTTMLNIIGGLDRYTSGDLIINGVSTKEYKDGDWDYYRNNSIGFVFQSYNLIPHQTVLANVEMALTLAGVSRKERRERAIAVLKKVGLADHIHKKPNQMSGGQMQRVAIARALVNNPDILLADEPTGALDSETSIQIMELLKEIAKDKLVIMVTHNPELARKYSTRIVNLLDGRITRDSDPYDEKEEKREKTRHKKISMSFLTALSLSFKNLQTKKGRTLLTAFAGSIGIIGIALILSLSTGMNDYIADVQKDTMSSYPITISDETIDVSGIMGMRGEIVGETRSEDKTETENPSEVYADYQEIETSEKITSNIVENNLTEFKNYLDDPSSEIHQYLGENGIVYSYDVNFSVYSYDEEGNLIDSDAQAEEASSMAEDAKAYLSSLGISEKASFYQMLMYYSANNTETSEASAGQQTMTAGNMTMDESSMAAALDQWLANDPDQELLVKVYDEYIAGSTYEENMDAFGKVSYEAPSSISIYTDSFENKDAIAACIESYNETADEDARITYTDYVAMLTSSVTTIIDGISYVLIAFVGISLIVSCIMIGIITHISVMERTKEIGILRALGASNRNISQVFNAETFIIGCCAGLLGIGVSILALIPINSLIERFSGITGMTAQLPLTSALLLIALSIVITILGGLLPAKKAAKKDPVIALRTE